MGWKTSLDTPEGAWQKGATSTLLTEPQPLYAVMPKRFFVIVLSVKRSQEWLEEMLTDDRVEELAIQDPRVPFVAIVVWLGSTGCWCARSSATKYT